MKNRVAVFFISFLCVFCALGPNAFAWKTARDLTQGWLYYDTKTKNYLPLSTAPAENKVQAVSTWVKYRELSYFFRFNAPKSTGIFIDGKLSYVCRFGGVQAIQLKKLPDLQTKEKYFITLYHPEGLSFSGIAELSVPEVGDSNRRAVKNKNNEPVAIIAKQGIGIRDGLVISVFLLAIGYVITRNASPRTLLTMLNPRDVIKVNLNDFAEGQRTALSATGIFLGLLNSLSVALVLYISFEGRIPQAYLLPDWVFYSGGEGTWVLLGNFVLIGLAYYIGKTALIGISASVFGIGRLGTAHQYEFMRFTTLMAFSCVAVTGIYYLADYNTASSIYSIFFYVVGIALILRAIKVSAMLIGNQSFGKLYLISYLCTTEVIPMIFVLKVLAE